MIWAIVIFLALLLLMFMSAAYTEIASLKEAIKSLDEEYKRRVDAIVVRVDTVERDVWNLTENNNLIDYGDIEKG